MFRWEKKGLIYKPNKKSKWPTHAVLPFIDQQNDQYYVYFASRTKDNVAYSFRAIFDYENKKVVTDSNELVLEPGEIGYFDQHGAIASSIVSIGNVKFLYYIGWTKGHEAPLFYANIGLAISENGGKTFNKFSKVSIIPNDDKNPLLMTSPHVIFDNNLFYMVYISGVRWERNNGSFKSYYRVCSAQSKNGIEWFDTGNIILDFQDDESNFARPWIVHHKKYFHMLFSKSSSQRSYSLGYAKSKNLKKWERDDSRVTIIGTKEAFDKEMICYPSIARINGKFVLLYNGNRFGYDGFGMATCDIT